MTSTVPSAAINVWQPVNINRSNRPVLKDDEEIVYIRDNVGLYQGRVKIVNRQSGRVYLTNKRVIYIDNKDIKKSMAVDIDRIYLAATIDGFLRSSPKVKLYVNVEEDSKGGSKSVSLFKSLDWVCKICSFNNHLDSNYNLNNLPRCVSCGIPPQTKYIESLQNREEETSNGLEERRDDQCTKCTFINHPSLRYCEMCGSELKSSIPEDLRAKLHSSSAPDINDEQGSFNRLDIVLEGEESYSGDAKYVKLSFRTGNEQQFYTMLNEILEKRRWEELQSRGGVNQGAVKLNNVEESVRIKESGIYRLQLISEQTRKQNEMTLSSSLEDLEQLMYKAQDLLKLSSSFNSFIKPRVQYNVKLSALTVSKTSKIYHEELARHLSEYLTNYKLVKSSAMITLPDLFADYNRYLILTQGFGMELVTSEDFGTSVECFEKLSLPVVLREYDTGLKIVRPKFNDDYSAIIVNHLKNQEVQFKFNKLKQSILQSFDQSFDQDDYFKTGYKYFKGSTVSEISEHFTWSNDITIEELKKLVEDGLILIDKTISGTFYFINKITNYDFDQEREHDEQLKQEVESQLIKEQAQLEASNWGSLEPIEFQDVEYDSPAMKELKGLKLT
ncbi:Vacuolar protein-sorting-associated protein 36 [Yamadazyma tenuis]|uniref:Vacuolar protein-sorting-associated protein 36 n=1 Tax=Candida tenuis (strain ATCC 10573 / BCRC 21748 / CBS 615 / JCM 9827 / NBRC 10315 / NRRL Y-1498 / VKM Y-70) TaxID=590646 RepID=G3B9J8_CANTC|nr:uncharacterized protein CANTEDRAFT_125219 [Yamadazyma tenuis ATCC 10573]EGV61907.1 hypothetical protein CANTEDRAFT_125219 [Yamadazyma tenuis ATCC 10573]WEJ93141.1 Vacuolar protein-sorting-associated protein 36 [Yamadazyma tenuis]